MIVDRYREYVLLLLFAIWMCHRVLDTIEEHPVPTYCYSHNDNLQDCISCLELSSSYSTVTQLNLKVRAPRPPAPAPSSPSPPSLRESLMAYFI